MKNETYLVVPLGLQFFLNICSLALVKHLKRLQLSGLRHFHDLVNGLEHAFVIFLLKLALLRQVLFANTEQTLALTARQSFGWRGRVVHLGRFCCFRKSQIAQSCLARKTAINFNKF